MFVIQHVSCMMCMRDVMNYYNIIFVTDKYSINQIVKKSCIIVKHVSCMRFVIFLRSYAKKYF